MGALRVFATIFVWTFTLYCVKYNGANFIIKMCVNLHMNSNIHNEFPAQGANFIIKMFVNLHMNSNIHNEFPAPLENLQKNEHGSELRIELSYHLILDLCANVSSLS